MQDRTIDGQPRTSRRYSTDDKCPLPTLADKLLFILTYLKQNPLQEVHGQLFGMSQSHANTWIHVLHPVLNQALANQELRFIMVPKAIYQSLIATDHHRLLKTMHNLGPCCVTHSLAFRGLL